MRGKIAYTVGDPKGIGMDIILKVCLQQCLDDVVVLGCAENLQARAEKIGLDIEIVTHEIPVTKKGQIQIKDIPLNEKISNSTHQKVIATQVLQLLDEAIEGCRQQFYSAMVTGPLNKALINQAGISFSGHTEYLAEKTNISLPVMMLATDELRVALLTTHLPLKDVSAAIDEKLVVDVCTIVSNDLKGKYKLENPRILLCGLNPHAGENGYLGREEIDIFKPAIIKLRQRGINVSDPLPADTLFQPRYLDSADIVIACFHDQGLPVLKFHGFGRAANITLGLPIIRTSVDHGTAYDLVGSGKVNTGSLLTALQQARLMSKAQHSEKVGHE